jgi:hypothetical protein
MFTQLLSAKKCLPAVTNALRIRACAFVTAALWLPSGRLPRESSQQDGQTEACSLHHCSASRSFLICIRNLIDWSRSPLPLSEAEKLRKKSASP